jgi:hypothetical protein
MIGKAIFYILRNDSSVMASNLLDGNQNLIQPSPIKDEARSDMALAYEVDAVRPMNVKRPLYRSQTAPLYIVDFNVECITKSYSDSILLSDAVAQALQGAANDTYNGVEINGITLDTANQAYNKARKYYVKSLSFQARVLL